MYTIDVSCDIEWFSEESDFSSALFNAEIEFWGEDSGLRTRDDQLFTLLLPVSGKGGLDDLRPPKFEDSVQLSRKEFSLDEDKGYGLIRRGKRKELTDEIYIRLRLLPAEMIPSNQIRSATVTGQF